MELVPHVINPTVVMQLVMLIQNVPLIHVLIINAKLVVLLHLFAMDLLVHRVQIVYLEYVQKVFVLVVQIQVHMLYVQVLIALCLMNVVLKHVSTILVEHVQHLYKDSIALLISAQLTQIVSLILV
jgi:hypothetical protein